MPKRDNFSRKLTPKQEEFVEWYLVRYHIGEVIDEMDISERTARRWLTLPVVIEAIEQRRQERREAIQSRIQTCMDLAAELVHRVLHDAVYPDLARKEGRRLDDPDRVDKYLMVMLKYAQDQKELASLKLRIAQLEAQTQEQVVDSTVTRLPFRKQG